MNRHDPFSSLRIKEFRLFILARFIITVAVQVQMVIIAWKVYELTDDVLSLGLIGLAEAIPALSIALYAGHMLDNNDRRRIVLWSVGFLALCSVLLLILIINQPPDLVWYIYGVILLTGLARGFMGPGFFTLLAQIVPKSLYGNSSTWNSTSWQTGAIAGPAIGGILYANLGVKISMSMVIVLIIISLWLVLKIRSRGAPENSGKEGIVESLKAGLRFVFSNKIILGALSLDLCAVLFGGAVALLPVFAKDILKTGPEGLGFLRAAPSVGAFITMIGMAYRPPLKRAGTNFLLCVAGFGVCIILFAVSRNFYLSLFLLALSGAFDSVGVIIRSVILQVMTPENMRGRVSAVNTMFIGSSNELGAFESGFAARLLGTVPSVIFGGCMTLLVAGAATVKFPSLKNLDLTEPR
jgi:MFS family permease